MKDGAFLVTPSFQPRYTSMASTAPHLHVFHPLTFSSGVRKRAAEGGLAFAWTLRAWLLRAALLLCVLAWACPSLVQAQPAGWTFVQPFGVQENSGATLSNYQLRMTLDTASMVGAGQLRPDAADLRFGVDSAGATLMDYYIESGVNTASTVVWVKLPSLPASTTTAFFLFGGNPAASSTSTLNVFDFVSPLANSATNQVFGGATGGVTNSQRGFRFKPNQDVLLTELGKNEPNGSTRYITLFNSATQAIVAQTQVSGPAAQYSYAALAQPVWLTKDTEYILQIYQGSSDGYYFGTSSQINPLLTYIDMRYCNACTQNTFPTNTLSNYHYGYPDFQFRTTSQVSPAPSYALGSVATTTTLASSSNPSVLNASVSLTATVNFSSATGTVDFQDGGASLAGCGAVALAGGTAQCVTSSLSAGSHALTAVYAGSAGYNGSTSSVLAQVVSAPPVFVGAGAASLSVLRNAAATDIRALLHVSDPDMGQTLTWTQSVAPGQGTLVVAATAASGGMDIAPGGVITYQPAVDYIGADTLTVQVSDGLSTATRVVNISVVQPVAVPVPFLSGWGMALMSMLLLLAAMGGIKRRR